MKNIICPISFEKIDSNVSRFTVLIGVLFIAAFIVTKEPLFMIIATVDTLIRAVFNAKYSPMNLASSKVIGLMKLEKKPIDSGKKIFASRLGMLCGIASLILFYANYEFGALIVAGFWAALAILDSVFNFCVGCIIYNYIVYPFYKDR